MLTYIPFWCTLTSWTNCCHVSSSSRSGFHLMWGNIHKKETYPHQARRYATSTCRGTETNTLCIAVNMLNQYLYDAEHACFCTSTSLDLSTNVYIPLTIKSFICPGKDLYAMCRRNTDVFVIDLHRKTVSSLVLLQCYHTHEQQWPNIAI